MLLVIMGESCTGKSTLAEAVEKGLGGEIYSGKDYMRLAKSQGEAERLFIRKMEQAVNGSNLIFIVPEKEQLCLIPDGAVRILLTAQLDTIKERFTTRMHGMLPLPVAAMLEKKHGCFDEETADIRFESETLDIQKAVDEIRKFA